MQSVSSVSLQKWLIENHRSAVWLAERLGVHPDTVNRWLREKQAPSLQMRAQIEMITDATVLISSWKSRKRKQLERPVQLELRYGKE